jgi:hypothetical protein
MAKCYKMAISACIRAQIEPILQAPDGLQNPRGTNAFAIGNRAGKWSITTVQMGNNFAHTLRDGSQHLLVKIVTKKQRCDEHLLKWQLLNQIWTGLKLAINSD